MPKCIRCGKSVDCGSDCKGWVIITYNGPRIVEERYIKANLFMDVPGGLLWSGHTMIGLCPDCRIGCKDNLQLTEKGYTNLLGCLTTIEIRTANLEREMDRVWEVIRCKGGK